jgi:hypothetical protein
MRSQSLRVTVRNQLHVPGFCLQASKRRAKLSMSDDKPDREQMTSFLASFLAKETGITESQARELVEMLGTDRGSLLREARLLKKRNDRT